ncbi:MAG: Sbal_3080 family lipoprotein [Campylobacteraceae bacterium]|nr:Sbal_3080 family lipoprotein [Campylobacteraceae bacterium]
MKKFLSFLTFGIVVLSLSGCSTKQIITPVTDVEEKEVCITENKLVKGSFLQVFVDTLKEKEYQVTLKQAYDDVGDCYLVANYTANWSWDLAVYMIYANIKVFEKGTLKGEAVYDARGNIGFGKFINGDDKVRELVRELFK